MCITQSRRRKSLGLNLAAYAAAYSKPPSASRQQQQQEADTFSSRSGTVEESTFPTNGTPPNSSTTVVDRDGTTFAVAAFPDAAPTLSHYHYGQQQEQLRDLVAVQVQAAAGSTSSTVSGSSSSSSSNGDEFKPLEGKYVQGVYIPPSKPKPKRVRKPQKPGMTAKMHERHFVKHNYHDHSGEVPTGDEPSPEDVEAAILGQKKCAGGSGGKGQKKISISFPRKLHYLLDQIERDGLAHVISWLPHGRAFAIHDNKEFVDHVMPKYFNQSKLTSFQRQLNLYGFCRLTRGRDSGGYYNEHFLRGMPFLTAGIVRTRVKGTKFKAASNPDDEPNFYAMRPVSLPSRHPLVSTAKGVASLVSASEESSTASSSASSSVDGGSVGNINGNFNHVNPPNQVVVPSVDTGAAAAASMAPFADGLSFTPMAANHSGAAASAGTPAKVSICDLWDSLEVFEPNPYRSPKSSPKVPVPSADPTTMSVPIQALPLASPSWEEPVAMDVTPAAVVTAPPSRSDSGNVTVTAPTAAASASASVPPAQSNNDPLLDLVESWATTDDDFMADVVEQAIENDLDFGHLLDIIAQE